MLEDDFTWVLRKALKGLALSPGEAASRAGLPEKEVLAFSRGAFSAATARAIAPVLGLDPDAFALHDHYHPAPLDLPEIQRLELPFGSERVNAWLIHSGNDAILFDTGDDPHSCADALARLGVPRPGHVLITHAHGDHIGGISPFLKQEIPVHGAEINRAKPLSPGETITAGRLTVRACDLSGHANPSLGYHVGGLAR